MEIKLPKLGEGADSGTVVNVLVQEGDSVEKGQALIELENEKAVAPIPSTAAGTVQSLRVKTGDKISVGQVLVVLSTQDGTPQKNDASAERNEDSKTGEAGAQQLSVEPAAPAPEPVQTRVTGGVVNPDPVAPPSVRKLARDVGIDLKGVVGSGPGGRISLDDLRAYVQKLQAAVKSPKQTQTAPVESIDFSQWGPVRHSPLAPIRQTISRRMLENWQSIPHVTQFDEFDITELNRLRKQFAKDYEKGGARLTLTPIVIKAVVQTLKQHPILNASLDEAAKRIVYKDYYHVGLAVDTEQGLLVPVIRDADQKSLLELANDVNTLAEKARQRSLSLDEMKGGTFTLSNQGGIGGGFFTPIINKPEVAILGLGRGQLKTVYKGTTPEPRLLMPVGLSYDHRVIDGGTAARFVADLGSALAGMNEDALRPDKQGE